MNSSYLRRVVLLAALCAGDLLYAQTRPDSVETRTSDVQESAEPLLDQIETESEKSEIIDRLNWLQQHPFNLNSVSKEELQTIPGITPFEAAAVIDLRKSIKRFTSLEQLKTLEDSEILRKVRLYVVVEEDEYSRSSINVTSRASRDLQPRKGFQDSSFAGSSLKNYNRITLSYGNRIQSGILFEKDAGEKIGDSFLSGYLAVKDWSIFSQIVVGDYVVEAGQGLVLWRSSAFGKGSEAVSVAKKTGLAAQPYRSSDEFNFLRGAVVSSDIDFGGNKLSLTALFSHRSLSASGDDESVSSFYEGGLYRTESELDKKSQVREKIVGARARFASTADWNVGGTFYRSMFDKPIIADRFFEFSGMSSTVTGVDAEMNLGWLTEKLSQITLFGEAARDGGGAVAGIFGSILNLNRNASFALIYRNYSPRFTSLHAAGFGERTETKNERGFYIGTNIRMAQWFHLSGYLDHFDFPWRTFDNPLPTRGRDFLMQADAELSRGLDVSARYSNKMTETNEPSLDELGRETRLLVDRLQQKLRLTATFQANKKLRVKGRFETVSVNYDVLNRNENGYLLYQELQYALPFSLLTQVRLIFFDTDSYDSRLYEYENDLRGIFSNPALYGKGKRWYVLLKWRAADIVHLSAKYSETEYEDRTTISSGSTEIQGNLDNRLAVQLELKF